jgi:hypothetical protein
VANRWSAKTSRFRTLYQASALMGQPEKVQNLMWGSGGKNALKKPDATGLKWPIATFLKVWMVVSSTFSSTNFSRDNALKLILLFKTFLLDLKKKHYLHAIHTP